MTSVDDDEWFQFKLMVSLVVRPLIGNPFFIYKTKREVCESEQNMDVLIFSGSSTFLLDP